MAAFDKIEQLLDVIAKTQDVHMPFLRPIQALAVKQLEPHAVSAQAELDALNEAEAAEEARKVEAAKKEADAIAAKEAAANQSVRRDIPPLSSPPAR